MASSWKKLSSKYVYQNPWMKVREDQVVRPDGKEGIYGVVKLADGISVVPVDEGGKIWMVKHRRYIFGDERWELVDGDIEKGESAETAARRELFEELGMSAGNLNYLGRYRPSDGLLVQKIDVFLATSLSSASAAAVEPDIKGKKAFTLAEINEMIRNGEILCGFVTSALYFYKLHLNQ